LHNFAQAGDGFHRMEPNGNRLAATLRSPAKSLVIRCRFQQGVMRRVLFIAVQIAGAIFLACAGSGAWWHASPVAARTTVANSMRGFG
jgi:hypothetical protein